MFQSRLGFGRRKKEGDETDHRKIMPLAEKEADTAGRKARPFLKWAGGKTGLLGEIRKEYPEGLGTRYTKYAEPFVGGGAVLFDVLGKYDLDGVYIGDLNRELIATYRAVRDSVSELITALYDAEEEYIRADEDTRKRIYISGRERFNGLKAAGDESVEIAKLFIFLNRTCFNGLYRVNSGGAFNVPHGKNGNPTICDEDNLRKASRALRGVTISCAGYGESRGFTDDKTFVYLDPPYRPLTETSNFTAYATPVFGDKEQIELAAFVDEMSERGAHVVASNSDPRNADGEDDFFDRLYSRHRVSRIFAGRSINSVGSRRGKIGELLISTTGKTG
jgi:DNA adenine methylase